MDITSFMNWFLLQFAEIFTFLYSLLGSITFNGTSLLKVSVSCIIIGIIIDLFVASVRTRAIHGFSKDNKKPKSDKSTKKGESNDN